MKKEERNIYKQQAIDLYINEKLSMNKIAKILKISDSTVKTFLDEENIEIRKNYLSYTVKPDLFKEIKTEEDAYWLGLLYADGYVASKGYGVELSLKAEDQYLVQQFNDYCGVTKPLKQHIIRKNNKEYISYRCNFTDKNAHDNLIQKGCLQAKSLILKCPTEEQVPTHLLPDFIRGYCDGDGTLGVYRHSKTNPSMEESLMFVGTKPFLEGVQKYNEQSYPKQLASYSPKTPYLNGQRISKKSILGRYLRNRLNVGVDEIITKQILEEYGRTSITLSLVGEGVYFADFSVDN